MDRAPRQSEGDINMSSRRAEWQAASLNAESRALLKEDARYFLHQSLSTPCLNALRGCDGIYLEDLQGRRYMDFHGNSVHQVGFANPAVIAAVKAQLDELSFSPRRYTKRPLLPERHRGDRHRPETRAGRHRAAQGHLDVGCLPRRLARRHLGGRGGTLPPRHRAAPPRDGARPPAPPPPLPLSLS